MAFLDFPRFLTGLAWQVMHDKCFNAGPDLVHGHVLQAERLGKPAIV